MPESDLISLAEYAKLHNVTIDNVRQKILRGNLPQAYKIGRNWVIPRDAPYEDYRLKSGQYVNWRRKKPQQQRPDSENE